MSKPLSSFLGVLKSHGCFHPPLLPTTHFPPRPLFHFPPPPPHFPTLPDSSPTTSFSPPPPPPPPPASSSLETLNLETLARSPLGWVPRNDLCGKLGPADVARCIRLYGWVAFHRVHGCLTFINLRDHSGLVQVTTLPEEFPEAYMTANRVSLKYVVAVEGTVRARPGESQNKKMGI